MTIFRHRFMAASLLLALGGLQAAGAATITSTLGNSTPTYNNGDTPPVFTLGQVGAAPFDQGYGTDGLFGGNFEQSWTHSYGLVMDPILSASITIGIFDHDSAASGSQLALFDIDSNDLTASLDSLFEVAGDGLDGMYNEYTLSLDASLFPSLADGGVLVSLNLMGPGLVANLFGGGTAETSTNGANLIFSTLTIETGVVPQVPVPAAAPLFMSALFLIGWYRRRVLGERV